MGVGGGGGRPGWCHRVSDSWFLLRSSQALELSPRLGSTRGGRCAWGSRSLCPSPAHAHFLSKISKQVNKTGPNLTKDVERPAQQKARNRRRETKDLRAGKPAHTRLYRTGRPQTVPSRRGRTGKGSPRVTKNYTKREPIYRERKPICARKFRVGDERETAGACGGDEHACGLGGRQRQTRVCQTASGHGLCVHFDCTSNIPQ